MYCIEYSYLVLDTIYFARSKICPSEIENKPAHASVTSDESTATTQLLNNTKDSCIPALEDAWTSFHDNRNSSTESDVIVTKKVCEPEKFPYLYKFPTPLFRN